MNIQQPKSKKNRYYCKACIQKFKRKTVRPTYLCPTCDGPLTQCTAMIAASVINRMRRSRGLPVKSKKRRPKSEYLEYLGSALWKRIRAEVMRRDNFTCQMCKNTAELVHHKSYDQPVMDGVRNDLLISLCQPCHKHIEFTQEPDGRLVKNNLKAANAKLESWCRRSS